jgi:hypothetical protein
MSENTVSPLGVRLAELGLGVTSEFVPTTAERTKDLKVRWRVTLTRNGKDVYSTEYTQGIGHLEGANKSLTSLSRLSMDGEQLLRLACREEKHPFRHQLRAVPPKASDVWACILSDADALDHPSFESWASDYGFDEDSRKAERIYQTCLAAGLALRSALGEPLFSELKELARRE